MKISDYQDDTLISFLDAIHGNAKLVLLTRKPNAVYITRSSLVRDYEMRREYYNYIFQNDKANNSVKVNWRDAEGVDADISNKFIQYMDRITQDNETSEEQEMVD